jgi:hypothetical protein
LPAESVPDAISSVAPSRALHCGVGRGDVPAAGAYLLSADIASINTDTTGNTGPGRYELMLDGQVLDVVDFSGTLISVGQVMRDTLTAEINNLPAGNHTLRLMFVRTGTNTRHIYQYVDDITLTPLAGVHAVPEPQIFTLAGIAACSLPLRRRGLWKVTLRR